MPDGFLDPLLERFGRPAASMRIGTLTAIDTPDGSVTVSLAGDLIPGVRWVGSYTPTVADIVVVSRVDTMWVVLGKLSKQFGAPSVVYGTTVQYPASQWSWTSGGGWVAAGARIAQTGSGGINSQAGLVRFANPAISGATILSAKLMVEREVWDFDGGEALAQPVFYGVSATTPPSGASSTYAATAVSTGYGPWRPGSLTQGQVVYWDLPSSWMTGLLSSGINSFMIYTTAVTESLSLTSATSLVISYSVPA